MSKQLYGHTIELLGFHVDPNAMLATLSYLRKTELITAINEFCSVSSKESHRRPLRTFQTLTGWINWALNVYPLLRPGLCAAYAKMAGKTRPNAKVFVSRAVVRELQWIAAHLHRHPGIFFMDSLRWGPNDADLVIYTDTSGLAMGFYCPILEVGFQSDLPERPKLVELDSEIFYYEAFTVCAAIDWAAALTPCPKRLAIYTDNDNTVSMYNTLRAKPAYNDILIHSVDTLLAFNMQLRVVHIAGKDNIIADALSRRRNEHVCAIVPSIVITEFTPPRLTLGAAEE